MLLIYKNNLRGENMDALWFVFGFAVTTTVVLATEKILEKA
nr:MAG TPA: hypothetical protein [Caudoviricetes sp.]